MLRTLGATALLALSLAMPAQQATAQEALGGAIFGGAAGAILGGALGGRGGAIAGGIIGGTMGAAIGAEGERRRGGYYWHRGGCYIQRGDGAWMAVDPGYCGGPVEPVYAPAPPPAYGPPPAADGPPPAYGPPPARVAGQGVPPEAIAECARRYRSYDPVSMTFLSTDGYRKPCPSY